MKQFEQARSELLDIFKAGLAAVEGRAVVARYLAQHPVAGACSLVALGKAAGAMALGALESLGEGVIDGLVISKPGHLPRELFNHPQLTLIEGGIRCQIEAAWKRVQRCSIFSPICRRSERCFSSSPVGLPVWSKYCDRESDWRICNG